MLPEGEPETERQAKAGQQQKDEEVAANNSDGASSDTLEEPDIVHVVGDIVQVRCFSTTVP